MSYIVKRAKLSPGKKVFGVLNDRIVIGEEAYRNNFTPLDANDPRREARMWATAPKPNSSYNAIGDNHEVFDRDYNKNMLFPSNATAGIRNYLESEAYDTTGTPLGQFHQNVVLTVSAGGSSSDLLAPGDVLFISNAGVLHRINSTTGIIEPVRYSDAYGSNSRNGMWYSTSATGPSTVVGTADTVGWAGVGIQINWPYLYPNRSDFVKGPWAFTDFTYNAYMYNQELIPPSYQNHVLKDISIVGQTDTHIVCSICKATKTLSANPLGNFGAWTGNEDSSYNAAYPIRALISIRKNDGYTIVIGTNHSAVQYSQTGISGQKTGFDPHGNLMHWKKKYSTTANTYLSFSYNDPDSYADYFGVTNYDLKATAGSIIAGDKWSEPTRFMDSKPNTGTAAKMYWMESRDYNHPDPSFPDTHCPMIMMLKWYADPVELVKGAAGMITPTPVQCTLADLPPEYQGAYGANTLRALLCHKNYDRYEMFEIEDNGEQYVVLWMGVNRSTFATSDVDANSNSNDATAEFYRYCVVFKVDSSNDQILHYVSDVGDFKYKKPMYLAVATEDNKTVVFADRNGLHPMRWNGASESFASLDPILLERVWSMGMSAGTSTDYATCWIETLDQSTDESKPYTFNKFDSDIYQLQIGDYKDVDLKYIDADTVEHLEFSSSLLITEKDVNGNYIAKTFDILVRIKSQTGATILDFESGNTIAFKISGGNMETDGLYIEGYDSGNPYLKTITSGSDWVTVTVNYRLPLTRVTLSATIV